MSDNTVTREITYKNETGALVTKHETMTPDQAAAFDLKQAMPIRQEMVGFCEAGLVEVDKQRQRLKDCSLWFTPSEGEVEQLDEIEKDLHALKCRNAHKLLGMVAGLADLNDPDREEPLIVVPSPVLATPA